MVFFVAGAPQGAAIGLLENLADVARAWHQLAYVPYVLQ